MDSKSHGTILSGVLYLERNKGQVQPYSHILYVNIQVSSTIWQGVLDKTPKAQATRAQKDKWGSIYTQRKHPVKKPPMEQVKLLTSSIESI
jgi:hypothetical protein